MRQILITPEIKAMAREYANNLFADKSDAFVQPVKGLRNLIIDLKEVNNGLANKERYINYLKEIIKDYKKLKNLLPTEFDKYKTKYDGIIEDSPLSSKIKYRRNPLPSKKADRVGLNVSEKEFYKLIVDRMHYDDSRLYLGPYMKKIGINTCVYCNIAKATYSENRKEVYFPFDHCKPKSDYPFLCITFFNLYPSCTNCNGHKLADESKGFQLYKKTGAIGDPFVFQIDRTKIEEGDPDTLEVEFKSRNVADKDLSDKYDECYRIREFYNSDDEKRSNYQMWKLIEKHRASYLKAMEASFPLTVDREELFSVVLGVKDDEIIFTDIRKKLKLDTAKDANLL